MPILKTQGLTPLAQADQPTKFLLVLRPFAPFQYSMSNAFPCWVKMGINLGADFIHCLSHLIRTVARDVLRQRFTIQLAA